MPCVQIPFVEVSLLFVLFSSFFLGGGGSFLMFLFLNIFRIASGLPNVTELREKVNS